ncbi:hypothetical protein T03_2892 [Trichinella britovi]|uniref:Uncharacterized protein n=1 Tax=Trichinella britovi TaxID=45882 RepID=A0A0V1CR83_TRIBR|nr:hypothetical protein T03_2892 [Trichinella britovi]
MDYVIIRKFLFSRSRCHSQIAFPMVLMFVTQVHNCEDESRILISIEYRKIMACLSSLMA